MSPGLLTVVMFGGLFGLLLMGVPIAFAMSGIASVVILFLWGFNGFYIIIMNIFGLIWNIVFINIPLFILMGVLLERSGIAEELFDCIYKWTCRIRGGLALGSVFVCIILGAITGVAGADTVIMGLVALPAMLNRGYDKILALGTIAGAGTLTLLIPPSITMILISLVAEISVGKLLMAGVIPGVILAGMFMIYIIVRTFFQPHLCPRVDEKFTWKEKFVSVRSIILPLLIILVVMGTMFFGLATPTEASAIGCIACLIPVAMRRRLTWALIKESTNTTFSVTAMILWVAFGAVVFSNVYISLGGPHLFTDFIMGLEVRPVFIFASIVLVILILGCFLDPTGIIFIVAPIAFPILKKLGYDPIWFGIIFVIGIQCGYLTPPFGFSLFYLKGVVPPSITMADIYRSVWPFVGVMITCIALLYLFPSLATYLPDLMVQIQK
jgi:tripartite ATP-independent transporter DctM subunit